MRRSHILRLTATALLISASLAGAQDKTSITVLSVAGLEKYTQAAAAAYMKEKPSVTVKVEVLPFDQLFQQIQVRLSSNSASPDVLYVDGPVVASYGAQNFLAPMDSYFNKAELDAFIPAVLKTSYYQKKLLATPVCSSSMVLYYNRDLLQKAGVPIPVNDPAKRLTYEQLAQYAQKATIRQGGRVTSWGLTFHQADKPYQLLPLVQSLGGEAIGEDGLSVKGVIDSPAWVKAMQYYGDLHNRLGVSPKGNVDGWQLFQSGKAAFFIGVPYFGGSAPEAVKKFNWGFAPNPYFAGGVPVTTTDCWHVGVNKNSPNVAVSADFVKYLTNGKGQDIYWQQGQLDPVLKRHVEVIKTDKKYQGTVARLAAQEAVTTAQGRPVTPGYNEYQDILTQAMANIRSGQDAKAALSTAADQIDRAMAKYRK